MIHLLIATNNKDKIEELQDLLKDLNVQLVTPEQIGLDLEVVEDELTYAENAGKKALAFAQASGLLSLADDSGLEVDALNGEPGLYSKRFSPKPNATDRDRRTYLLGKLHSYPRPWTARFKATIAIVLPESSDNISRWSSSRETAYRDQAETLRPLGSLRVTHVEGSCEGEIIPDERGTGGFGYDPIFLFPELGKTMAELSMDEKNRLSHRAKAVMSAKAFLATIF